MLQRQTPGGSFVFDVGTQQRQVPGTGFIFVQGATDSTAPTLTSPTSTATGAYSASGTVTTDEANGTLYYLVNTTAIETVNNVKTLGLTQSITTTGVKSVVVSGLTSSTLYYLHFVHTDSANNNSTVAVTSFTTEAAPSVSSLLTKLIIMGGG